MHDISGFLDKLTNNGFQYYYNLDSSSLVNMSVSRDETTLLDSGGILLNTSPHTGRAAQDRFLVRNQSSLNDIHWSNVNKLNISQKTIKESIELKGIGLHNGIKVNLWLKPAEPIHLERLPGTNKTRKNRKY